MLQCQTCRYYTVNNHPSSSSSSSSGSHPVSSSSCFGTNQEGKGGGEGEELPANRSGLNTTAKRTGWLSKATQKTQVLKQSLTAVKLSDSIYRFNHFCWDTLHPQFSSILSSSFRRTKREKPDFKERKEEEEEARDFFCLPR